MDTRIERDPLGEYAVPAGAYYGIQTARALDNFPISGLRAHPDLVTATILIKKAAALANMTLDRLPRDVGEAIVAAAENGASARLTGAEGVQSNGVLQPIDGVLMKGQG